MNKKEVSEIKRAINSENAVIHTIYSGYINSERKKVFFKNFPIVKMEEEELNSYIKIFQKILSSKIEKNFLNLDFEQEKSEENINKLFELSKKEHNKDELERFVDKIIESYDNEAAYSIMIGFGRYGIPVKAKDGEVMDFSNGSYDFMIFAICPMDFAKPNLEYEHKENIFNQSKTNLIVSSPKIGFIYPNFSGRESNAYQVGYFVKKTSEQHDEIKELLGLKSPLTAEEQKDKFAEIVGDAFNGSADIKSIVNLNERAVLYLKEKEKEDETGKMDRMDVNHLLKYAGADYEVEDAVEIMAENIAQNNYTFENEGIKVVVKGDYINYLSKEKINGKNCLVIPLDGDSTLNGFKVK